MNVNSTSSYVNNPSSNKGFSGMASGMDTESMVEALLSGTQAKIDKQNALKQQTIWKQEIYRDLITQINSFQSKFFKKSFSDFSSTSLMSPSFFNAMSIASTSSAIRASVDSSAAVGSHSVKVSQLATASKVTSTSAAGKHDLEGTANISEMYKTAMKDALAEERTVSLSVNGKAIDVDFSDLVKENAADNKVEYPTPQQIADRLNEALSKFDGISATVNTDGKVVITSTNTDDKGKYTDEIKVLTSSSSEGLAMTGLVAGASLGKDGTMTAANAPKTEGDVTFNVDITYDGAKTTVKIDMEKVMEQADEAAQRREIQRQFQEQVDFAFGEGKVQMSMDDTTGGFKLSTQYKTSTVMISGDNANQTTLGVLNGESNRIGIGGDLGMYFKDAFDADGKASFSINGKTIEVNKDMTISEMMRAVNNSGAGVTMTYQSNSGTFSLTANSSGDGFKIDIQDTNGSLMASVFGADGSSTTYTTDIDGGTSVQDPDSGAVRIGNFVEGKDAIFEFDGVAMARNSNTISQDGLTMTFTNTTDQAETLTVNRNTDQIVDGIKGFIEEYNALLDKINGLVDADAEYRDYAPLTDAQKKEMTEKEIEKWEEKAKTGLLRRDNVLESFLQSMRSVLYERPADSAYALYDLGIDTGDYTQKGKLFMDADGEAKLRAALESNPDEVAKLFTSEDGIGNKMNDILNGVANTSSGSPGTLVQIAGVKGGASEASSDYNQRLSEIEQKIKNLKNAYELEKNRYWSKFNAMEKLVSQMSSQSAWLSQQFGY